MMAGVDIKRVALAGGTVWGLGLFGLGLISAATGGSYGAAFINAIGSVYLGLYTPTYLGAVLGGILGFIDMGIGGAIFAWVYNYFGSK